MFRKFLFSLCLINEIVPANAAGFNGDKLLELCRNPTSHNYVAMYVAGVVDSNSSGVRTNFCPPLNGTMRQAAEITCAYLEAHPTTRHYQGASLVDEALKEAWSCVSLD